MPAPHAWTFIASCLSRSIGLGEAASLDCLVSHSHCRGDRQRRTLLSHGRMAVHRRICSSVDGFAGPHARQCSVCFGARRSLPGVDGRGNVVGGCRGVVGGGGRNSVLRCMAKYAWHPPRLTPRPNLASARPSREVSHILSEPSRAHLTCLPFALRASSPVRHTLSPP